MARWRVVPLSVGQLRDVSPEDVLEDGRFRRCNTYKGGGGYDTFPEAASRRFGPGVYHTQFVVQLYGCNLDCPFCYVTRAGVWGTPFDITTDELVRAFERSECAVFHLMGGAPALALNKWPALLEALERTSPGAVFHSDLMLTEREYDVDTLLRIARPRALYAVGLKGITSETFRANTRKEFPEPRLWRNLERLEAAEVPYYVTFTNVPELERQQFWDEVGVRFGEERGARLRADELTIDLIEYEALPHVDDVPWGGR